MGNHGSLPADNSSSQPRYNGPSEDEMTDEQRQIRQEILATRPGTGLKGPFGPWLAVPDIARPAQALGKACRYGTSLSFRESELVILLTARKTQSDTEFEIHRGEAMKAGHSVELIERIPKGNNFSVAAVIEFVLPLLHEERERVIATFTTELLETSNISDETYRYAKQKLDNKDSILVEITSIVGYYTYVAYTLNVFRIPP